MTARDDYPHLARFAAGSSGGDPDLIERRSEAARALDALDGIQPGSIGRKGAVHRHNYQAITAAAWRARDAGLPIGHGVAQELGIDPKRASNLVQQARRAGFNVPGQATTPGTADRVVMCDDCPAEFDVADIAKLVRHVVAEHHRPIRKDERTPLIRGRVA